VTDHFDRPHIETVVAPAKLNLFLEVLGRRADGYHELETVMVAVDWADRLTFRRTDRPGVRLICNDPTLPADVKNLAYRGAAAALSGVPNAGGVEIVLEKDVPAGAGMGGGSSDAAAALAAVNRLLGRPRSVDDLAELAAGIGSDVPFFLRSAAAVCRGRGERIEPFVIGPTRHFVVVVPAFGLSTAEVYAGLSPQGAGSRAGGSAEAVAALVAGDVDRLAAALFNRLEQPALRMRPEIAAIRDKLVAAGAVGAMMTGSGSAVFGLCRDAEHAERVKGKYEPGPGRRVRSTASLSRVPAPP
jgi:4-diphosphocytidyl-2-C-methyl-D-erythritol kinase